MQPSTKLQLLQRRAHGLEVWDVVRDGRRLHRFLSEAHARTRFVQILDAARRAATTQTPSR